MATDMNIVFSENTRKFGMSKITTHKYSIYIAAFSKCIGCVEIFLKPTENLSLSPKVMLAEKFKNSTQITYFGHTFITILLKNWSQKFVKCCRKRFLKVLNQHFCS